MAANRAALRILIVSGLLALFPLAARAQPALQPADERPAANRVEALLNQVVNISVTTYSVTAPPATNMAGQPTIAPEKNRASGVIIDPSGIIVTNRHAIVDATEIIVVLHDTTRLHATLLAAAPSSDIALLKVNAHRPLPVAKFGDSETLRPGDPVRLIGNPLGLGSTVTSGIVSAFDRNTKESGPDSFFQIDAALNRGNSGGPVFNAAGEVVGIATALLSGSGSDGSVGLGFAIPSNDAIAIVRALLDHGEVRIGWIGAHVERLTADTAAALGLPTTDGSIVLDVAENGPAWHAGLAAGDVILEVDGTPAGKPRILNRKIVYTPIGTTLALTLWRPTGPATISVIVSQAPAQASDHKPAVPAVAPAPFSRDEDFGLVLGPLTADVRRKLVHLTVDHGAVVVTVVPHSVADDHGVVPGSVILNIDRGHIASPVDARRAIDSVRAAKRAFAMLLIADEQGLRWVALPADPAPGGTR